jgi:hypothetical protein
MLDSFSDNEGSPVKLNKNKKKRKLLNQYALLSDDEDDDSTTDSTADSTESSIVANIPPNQGILNKKPSKGKSKKKIAFTTNCNQEKEDWLILKKDPQQAALLLLHP